jgi:putative membrane protein
MVVRFLRIFLISAALLGAAGAPSASAKPAASSAATSPAAAAPPKGIVTVTDVAPGVANGGDQEIVSELHLANQLTIALAELGRERASSPDVTALADAMASDRQAADVALLAYAQVKNMNMGIVSVPGSNLPPHGGLAMADVASSTPSEFDRAFMAKLNANQQGFVAQAEAGRRIARDPELRALIDMSLPGMREAVSVAQALERTLPRVPPAPRAQVPLPAPPP